MMKVGFTQNFENFPLKGTKYIFFSLDTWKIYSQLVTLFPYAFFHFMFYSYGFENITKKNFELSYIALLIIQG